MEWLLLLFSVLFWIRNHFHIVHEYIRRFSSTALILGLFGSTLILCFKGMQRKTRVRQSSKYSILHLELEMWSIDERNTRARRGLDFAVCMQSLSHIFALLFFRKHDLRNIVSQILTNMSFDKKQDGPVSQMADFSGRAKMTPASKQNLIRSFPCFSRFRLYLTASVERNPRTDIGLRGLLIDISSPRWKWSVRNHSVVRRNDWTNALANPLRNRSPEIRTTTQNKNSEIDCGDKQMNDRTFR
jgi:hypothetical protein